MKNLFISACVLVIVLTGFIAISGFGKASSIYQQAGSANKSDADTAGMKYLALGDSYTIGQSIPLSESFPAQTVQWLKNAGTKMQEPRYIATTGWATINLIYDIASKRLPHNYDVVTLLIGVNDQHQGRDTGTYRVKFTEVLHTAVNLAGGRSSRVFVLSIPDYSAMPCVEPRDKARVRADINRFNAINKQVTLQNNVAYLNITPLTREAQNDSSLIAFDDLHPSGAEYKKWANLLGPMIKRVLQ